MLGCVNAGVSLILVEGLEDVAYILAYINVLERSDEYRRLGCHIVPANGKSELLQPVVIAKHMRIPTYLVFDADKPHSNGRRAKHEKDHKTLLTLAGVLDPEPMPDEIYWDKGLTMWHSDIGWIVQVEIGNHKWMAFSARADKTYGNAGALGKNTVHIGATLAFARETGKGSQSLEHLCSRTPNSENVVCV